MKSAGSRGSYSSIEIGDTSSVSSNGNQNNNNNNDQIFGDMTKSLAFGGLDGLYLTFIMIAACYGGGMDVNTVKIVGISTTVANSLVYGINEYLAAKAHSSYIHQQKLECQAKFRTRRDVEIKKMINRFESQGMSYNHAKSVVDVLTQYESLFINIMIDDLGSKIIVEKDDGLIADSFILVLSFAIFGLLPLTVFYFDDSIKSSGVSTQMVAFGFILLLLVLLGSIKSGISSWYSGVEVLLLGLFCAFVSYFLGASLSQNII